jgi:DNA-directed RNA polymerase beta subunit
MSELYQNSIMIHESRIFSIFNGFNKEDSLLLNGLAIDKGVFNVYRSKKYKITINKNNKSDN